MSVYDKEDKLFTLAPELQEIRDLKELYINFNNTIFDNLSEAAAALSDLITLYKGSKFEMYRSFS